VKENVDRLLLLRRKESCVMSKKLPARVHRSILPLPAVIAAFSLCLFTTLSVQANTVTINDLSGVLDAGKVRTEAAKLSKPLLIFTTKTFSGDQNALDQSTRAQLPTQDAIAIGIDTQQRHLSIEGGTRVQLSDSQAGDALSAFKNNFHGGDYTGATIAAIDSLQAALSGGGSSITPLGIVIAIVLAGGVIILLMIVILRGRRPPQDGGRPGRWRGTYPYYGGYYGETHPAGTSTSGNYGGGAGGSFGGGGGAGGSF
jgi:hypothetical protein